MKPLDSIEIKLCRMQGKLFEASIEGTPCSSPVFIRRFMLSKLAKAFDNKSYMFASTTLEEDLGFLDEEFGQSSYGKIKYTPDEMFWIGYVYRCIAIRFDLSSKAVYRLFNAQEVRKYYNAGHTLDIVRAAEMMMESIDFAEESTQERALKIFRKLFYREKLDALLGNEVDVYIDRPAGSRHPEYDDLVYLQNYGYLEDLKAPDGEYQDAYVLGCEGPVDRFRGKVIAVIRRQDDDEDKLIVCEPGKDYTVDEIDAAVEFQEKYFRHRVIKA